MSGLAWFMAGFGVATLLLSLYVGLRYDLPRMRRENAGGDGVSPQKLALVAALLAVGVHPEKIRAAVIYLGDKPFPQSVDEFVDQVVETAEVAR